MKTAMLLISTAMLAACGAGSINSGSGTTAEDGGLWPGSDSLSTGGPEICDDGLDNDGDRKVDEQCACEPSSQPTQACYPGPPATRGVGQCKDGVQTCVAAGEFSTWSSCSGAVVPTVDDCTDGLDNDCNGKVDDGPGCACKPNESRSCYTGSAVTKDVGECRSGKQTCNAAGTTWSMACAGEVLPAAEICDDGKDNDCDGLVDEGCKSTHAPLACSTATMTHATGSSDCPANNAVYMMDDGMGPNFICCPLPATDILASDPPVTSSVVCGADQVIVGAVSPLVFKCKKINTKRYKLGPAAKPCYFGSGWSGASGASKCLAHPANFSVLQQNSFGSDGCSGYPYGALFTQQLGKDCSDMLVRQVLYAGAAGDPPAGTPVVMFKP